jgi:hypothetical protein
MNGNISNVLRGRLPGKLPLISALPRGLALLAIVLAIAAACAQIAGTAELKRMIPGSWFLSPRSSLSGCPSQLRAHARWVSRVRRKARP